MVLAKLHIQPKLQHDKNLVLNQMDVALKIYLSQSTKNTLAKPLFIVNS